MAVDAFIPGFYISFNRVGRSMKGFTVCVEGNIGSGKTTFLRKFQKWLKEDAGGPSVRILEEPVDEWRNLKGHNILELMYEDPKRWGYVFQSYVALTATKLHSMRIEESIKMMERSLWTAEHCFATNLYRSGKMAESEFTVLSEWYSFIRSNSKIHTGADLFVYLRTSPEVALQRVIQRDRSEESSLSLQYLKDLHLLHEEALSQNSSLSSPVLILDADQDLQTSPYLYRKVFPQILESFRDWEALNKENSLPVA